MKKNFGVSMTDETVRTYLEKGGFIVQVMKTDAHGFKLNKKNLMEEVHSWLRTNRNNGVLTCSRDKLLCVDVTYTGHRLERRTTYNLKNSPQPKSKKKIPRHTNQLFTGLLGSGEQLPCLLFTHNQRFNLNRSDTRKRKREKAHISGKFSKSIT